VIPSDHREVAILAPSQNVASSEITKQPSINVQFIKSGLNFFEFKHGNHSVTAGEDF
jgi:hypothetical protein